MDEIRSNCRFYENRFPEIEDLVTVQVMRIEDHGAYVKLLEYNDIEGMILLSELSRRRIRSIGKLIRIGRIETVAVLRVDSERGYIDLSKRRVSPEDIAAQEDKYNKAKAVHSIMKNISQVTNRHIDELYEEFGWPLYKSYGHAYDAFKLSLTDGGKVFENLEIAEATMKALDRNIKLRLMPQPMKIRCDFEATCFGYEGVDAIKAALIAGEKMGTEDLAVKIRLIAPPLYVMTTVSSDKEAGIEVLNQAKDKIAECLEGASGKLTVKMEPKVVGEREDKQLLSLMERLEKQNIETSGDDDNSDEED